MSQLMEEVMIDYEINMQFDKVQLWRKIENKMYRAILLHVVQIRDWKYVTISSGYHFF